MATESINSASPITPAATNQASPLQTGLPARTAAENPAIAKGAVQNSNYETDRVNISSEAARKVPRQATPQNTESVGEEKREIQGTQPTQQEAPSASKLKSTTTAQTVEAGAGTERNGDNASNISRPSPAEIRSNRNEEQAERQVRKAQTIQNYSNASLSTQINGRKIDENV